MHGQGSAKYETVRVGLNSRLDTIQAAILLAKIAIFKEETQNRNFLADRYHRGLRGVVAIPEKPEGVVSAWAQYTVCVPDRDYVKSALAERGIPTAVYYPLPMHLQPAYSAFGQGVGSLPVSEQLSDEVLSLPMNPYWTEQDAEYVIDGLKRSLLVSA